MTRARHIACCMTAGTLLFLALICLPPQAALAHAFPDRADPKVGATLTASPSQVRIWFDRDLEPVLSNIKVCDAQGHIVDNGDGRVNPADSTLLEVSVPQLSAGKYRVIWSAVVGDGHRTTGDYTFRIK